MRGHGRLKKDIPIYVIDVETWGLDATKLAFGVIMNAETHEFVVFWTWVEARRILKEMAEESKFVLYAHNGWKYDYLGLFTIDQIKQSNKLDKQGRIIMAQIDGYEARDFKCLVPAPLSVIGEPNSFLNSCVSFRPQNNSLYAYEPGPGVTALFLSASQISSGSFRQDKTYPLGHRVLRSNQMDWVIQRPSEGRLLRGA